MRLSTNNPYQEVIDIIRASKDFHYTDYIVLLRICGHLENTYLACDGVGGFEWHDDWADVPSIDIEVLGFCPLEKIALPHDCLMKDYIYERGLERMALESDGIGNINNCKDIGQMVKEYHDKINGK